MTFSSTSKNADPPNKSRGNCTSENNLVVVVYEAFRKIVILMKDGRIAYDGGEINTWHVFCYNGLDDGSSENNKTN